MHQSTVALFVETLNAHEGHTPTIRRANKSVGVHTAEGPEPIIDPMRSSDMRTRRRLVT
jgi:hypothetical protein